MIINGYEIEPRADLRDANLCRTYLGNVNLCRADLREANLHEANLHEANLHGADLRRADLRGADLYGTDLRGADLCSANLYDANLCRTYLGNANLRGADLRRADLRGADLRGADLSRADLYRADLRGADLYGVDLRDANLYETKLDGAALSNFQIVPDKGSFIGYKKVCDGFVLTLQIPADAARTSSLIGRKCRASHVRVLEANINVVDVFYARYDRTEYRVGEITKADAWDDDPRVECTHGIHFFVTREEAEQYE